MNVKMTRTVSGPPAPASLFTAQDMATIGTLSASQTVSRTFNRGLGLDDAPHARYSTRALKVYSRSPTGRALVPKGGEPFPWVRGPRRRTGGYDASRIGDEAGKKYSGGYSQYKRESRKGVTGRGVEVDLVLTGDLSRQVGLIRSSATEALVGVKGSARAYAGAVDARRPFMGLSPKDQDIIGEAIADIIDGHLRGGK